MSTASQMAIGCPPPGGDTYNLSATLFTPETLYEERIDEQRWVVFAPDFEGYPVLIDANVRALLDGFRHGAVVSSVIARQRDFVSSLLTISALEERGFLRAAPARLPYATPPRSHRPKDFSIWLHITNTCNLKCAYCFVGDKTSDGMGPDVMSKVARDIRSTAERYGTENVYVKFAGGEPTIFVPRMECFRDILLEEMRGSTVSVRFGILSNGTLIGDKLLAFLKKTDTALSISLDGYGSAHDIFRINASGKGSWDIVSKNIENLVSNGIKPYIMATISQESCHSLPDLVRWIYAHGLSCRLSVVRNPNSSWAPLITIGVAGGDRRREYEAMNATLAAAFDRAFTLLEDPNVTIDLRSSLDLCELNFDHPSQGVTCGIGDNHLVIKPDGTLVSCPMTVMEKGIPSSGDLFATAAKTFPHSPADRYSSSEDDCTSCQWFGVCAGGCPITNLRVKGHAFTRSPLCSFYKAVIPRYLRFFGTKLRQAETRGPCVLPVPQEMSHRIANGWSHSPASGC